MWRRFERRLRPERSSNERSGLERPLLYSFGPPPDAEFPAAGLLAGKKGEYYGTSYGGSAGYGTVYEVTTAGKERVLHNFQGTLTARTRYPR